MDIIGPIASDGGAYAIFLMLVGAYYAATGLAAALSIGGSVLAVSTLASSWLTFSLLRLIPIHRRHWLFYPPLAVIAVSGCIAMYLGGGIAFLQSSLTGIDTTAQTDTPPCTVFGLPVSDCWAFQSAAWARLASF
jgi:hypothetical protein